MFINVQDPVSSKDCILVLPGGQFQLSLISKVQSKGFKVVCTDKSIDCPASTKADLFFPIGLDQHDELLNLATRLRPCAIITDQTDAGVVVASWLAKQLGLPGIDLHCASLFTQKHLMRQLCLDHGFPSPSFEVCTTSSEVVSAAKAIGFPLVIKPIDSQSSKGVCRVDNEDCIESSFYSASYHSSQAQVIVESFIEGPEFTVEGFMTKSGHRTLGISKKTHFPYAPMVAQSLLYEPESSLYNYDLLRHTHDRLMSVSGLPFGMTHAEYKLANGAFHLIEVAARGGGTRISSDIVPWISGVDYQGVLVDAALGKFDFDISYPLDDKYALLEFFATPQGSVRAIKGVEAAQNLLGVMEVVINCHVGQALESPVDDTVRVGYFIVLSESRSDLDSIRAKVLRTVQIEVEP